MALQALDGLNVLASDITGGGLQKALLHADDEADEAGN